MRGIERCWEERRNRLNHDWLNNQFLVSFNKAINVIAGSVVDPGVEENFPGNLLEQWRCHRELCIQVVDDFEMQMSPKILIDEEVDKKSPWLGSVAHELWLKRENVNEVVYRLRESFWKADENYKIISNLVKNRDTNLLYVEIEDYHRLLIEWRDVVEKLSCRLSELPHSVRVV